MTNTRDAKAGIKHLFLFLFLLIQFLFSCYCVSNLVISGDGIFSYTLANSPYSYDFIDHMLKHFPQDNGWIDAQVLREDYMTASYDRLNYAGVYWHRRIDDHPLLYDMAIHTLSSLFPGTFSIWTVGLLNLLGLVLIDLLFIRISRYLWDDTRYAVIPISLILLMTIAFDRIVTFPRMYALLGAAVLWYYCIHVRSITQNAGRWTRKDLREMILCIIVGTQIHYYFYLFAAFVSFTELIRLLKRKWIYTALNYVGTGLTGIFITMILYPWMLWPILLTPTTEHDVTYPWTISKIDRYFLFMNQYLLNGRWFCLPGVGVILLILLAVLKKRRKHAGALPDAAGHTVGRNIWCWIILTVTAVGYSIVVFRLDEGAKHYYMPVYLSVILLMTGGLVFVLQKIAGQDPVYRIIACSLVIFLLIFGTRTFTYPGKMARHHKEYEAWHQIALDHAVNDAIYIQDFPDNLFGNNWFELAQYRKFKVISSDSFLSDGITEAVLQGRSEASHDVMIYVPTACGRTEPEWEFLMHYLRYDCYLLHLP